MSKKNDFLQTIKEGAPIALVNTAGFLAGTYALTKIREKKSMQGLGFIGEVVSTGANDKFGQYIPGILLVLGGIYAAKSVENEHVKHALFGSAGAGIADIGARLLGKPLMSLGSIDESEFGDVGYTEDSEFGYADDEMGAFKRRTRKPIATKTPVKQMPVKFATKPVTQPYNATAAQVNANSNFDFARFNALSGNEDETEMGYTEDYQPDFSGNTAGIEGVNGLGVAPIMDLA